MNIKTAAAAALFLTATAFAAPDGNDNKQKTLEVFCNASANIAHDAMLSSLKGEKRPAIQKKLEAKYVKPFAENKNLSEIMSKQVKYSLEKTAAIMKESKAAGYKPKPAEYETLAMEVGKAEMEVCMKNLAQ
ncbi:MAG: hypothetical protein Q3966_08290 [Neisseria sp.]|nr:hypothetical protein [Neisseria sp.]